MNQPIHILTKMGVLTSFSIAKKITENDVNNFFKKHKKTGKKEEQIGNMLRDKIFSEIKDALENRKIPGLLIPNFTGSKLEEKINKNVVDLNRLLMVVSHKLMEKKYDKMSMCHFINSLVNLLGLSETDFEEFHRKMSNQNNEDEDEDE